MRVRVKGLVLVVIVAALACLVMLWIAAQHGFSARATPSRVEAWMARAARSMAMPTVAKSSVNPVAKTPDVLSEARVHFADHCALCHGNDGRGTTPIGTKLYPKPPDLGASRTQSLSDGEIFFIIKNGVRLTGMPAWGSDSAEDDRESWGLVHFIRHLPALSPQEIAEMRTLNPKSPREREEEEAERRYLQESPSAAHSASSAHHH
jgi:mono/diheme cytochrome c family protein